ncbi:protein of unknown function [Blastococcus saxobsidens DD2]|uniref:Uncharacterized protein n=1 Tax=Blastococcus saxobsidens (strain DD2) TaxID=1146883 RepID=H6RKE1_BLASD|nr:protein of unknown function [Blastococcus saxobsidens DD2]
MGRSVEWGVGRGLAELPSQAAVEVSLKAAYGTPGRVVRMVRRTDVRSTANLRRRHPSRRLETRGLRGCWSDNRHYSLPVSAARERFSEPEPNVNAVFVERTRV